MNASFLLTVAIVIVFLIALSFLGLFLAALFYASTRPIAQALAPVLGAMIGVVGVFLVTQLQFARQGEQKTEDANTIKTWLAGDVLTIGFQVQAALFQLITANLIDGRLPPQYFNDLSRPRLDRHRDTRVDWRLIPPNQLQHLEYIEKTINAYRSLLDQVGPQTNAVPDDLQRQFWTQLDHLRGQTGSYLRNFGRAEDRVFAVQLESFVMSDFAPTPGKAFSGHTIMQLMDRFNAITEQHAKQS